MSAMSARDLTNVNLVDAYMGSLNNWLESASVGKAGKQAVNIIAMTALPVILGLSVVVNLAIAGVTVVGSMLRLTEWSWKPLSRIGREVVSLFFVPYYLFQAVVYQKRPDGQKVVGVSLDGFFLDEERSKNVMSQVKGWGLSLNLLDEEEVETCFGQSREDFFRLVVLHVTMNYSILLECDPDHLISEKREQLQSLGIEARQDKISEMAKNLVDDEKENSDFNRLIRMLAGDYWTHHPEKYTELMQMLPPTLQAQEAALSSEKTENLGLLKHLALSPQ